MGKASKLMNTRGIISILMVISFILPYVDNLNLFQLVYHFDFPVVIIILALVDLGICFVDFNVKTKGKIYLISSIVILILCRSIFSYVGWFFAQISIGGKLMCALCLIHIVVSIIHIKKKDK